ncbi:lipocalin-like domain-containing protein [Caulobacter sp. DWR2-3-1b2]|uniref:lipocalin-like domain-containing protein n=1 Tax=unclassified Caulobacter TaxID=2648921 RepID=UPI003CEF4CAD
MSTTTTRPWGVAFGLTLAALSVSAAHAAEPSLGGTWILVAADDLHPGGARTHGYGEAPKGRLIVDDQGRYSLQIFKAERPRFALADKRKGTAAEFESAVLGSSTHYGTVTIDAPAHVLTFRIEGASYPNWEGTEQKRRYELKGEELSYQVPAAADGTIPISVWKRVR